MGEINANYGVCKTTSVTSTTSTVTTTNSALKLSISESVFCNTTNFTPIFSTKIDNPSLRIDFDNPFFSETPGQEFYKFKIVTDVDEKFPISKFQEESSCSCSCQNIVNSRETRVLLYKTKLCSCRMIIDIDNIEEKESILKKCMNTTTNEHSKYILKKTNKHSKDYLFVTRYNLYEFASKQRISIRDLQKIYSKSFKDLIVKTDPEYRNFSKFPTLGTLFYKIRKENQLKVLRILRLKYQNSYFMLNVQILAISSHGTAIHLTTLN